MEGEELRGMNADVGCPGLEGECEIEIVLCGAVSHGVGESGLEFFFGFCFDGGGGCSNTETGFDDSTGG